MKKILIGALLSLAACSSGASVDGAEKAVAQFHRELNSGDYKGIYAASDDAFKKVATEADTIKLLTVAHARLGAFQKGVRSGWTVNYNTSGNNTVLQYDSTYQKGKAVETFTFVGDASNPRLVGFNINSPLLLPG